MWAVSILIQVIVSVAVLCLIVYGIWRVQNPGKKF